MTAQPETADPAVESPPATPFHDLDAYLALPRVGGLALSPDGTRLITTVSTLDPARTAYAGAVWEIDAAGEAPARRLTRGAKGESAAGFSAAGDVLFTSARPDPDAAADGGDPVPTSLWLLPRDGGEGRQVLSRPGGLGRVHAARDADVLAFCGDVLPNATPEGAGGEDDSTTDAALRKERAKLKVSAVLHTGYPVRFWDADLGPGAPHLFTAALPADGAPAEPITDLTPTPGQALREADLDLTADGSRIVLTWRRPEARGSLRSELHLIDRATGEVRVLLADPGADLGTPRFSPDGSRVALLRESDSTPHLAPRTTLQIVDLADGAVQDLAGDWDRWPSSISWLPDSSALVVTADDRGRGPVFLVHLTEPGRGVEQLTHEDAVFTDVRVAPDGSALFALRTSYLAPAHPVRIELTTGQRGRVTALPAPAASPALPGRLTEISTGADGDTPPTRAWLALPEGAGPESPAPLLLWVHGGPLGSWNAWSWRWNPWLLVAQGYAVLLPDPALSTGYGQEFVQRGWGAWGAAPYTDLMAVTDVAEARPDIDASRTAAMGGSFGGYMANWIAGHTDRFRAIVTHASLWALDQFGPTTDAAYYWQREMTPQMAAENSPHRFVTDIVSPMLVIHGDKDYRVPIGEGLRLWYELLADSGRPAADDGTTDHRFLYFPDENHWVLSPQNSKVWYQVVSDFLDRHVLGGTGTELPPVLGAAPRTR
ncbi:S9 family peptidase [Nakamurella flavida]|uniref:S9 family peptidase n=1 Tax=Nakamurella flavida TaxID=363630 RepID=A0A939C738_9ACTN|nr:alpha/beta fold hydrolase [Nakamurella flavida]MBM9477767.1 S9 family peptidase [Nakamurella flavida]MDP9779319.1 dipeptidyl aminopeptidase/acylaminoacyl peptidase [Nakamurella flavida]